MYFVIYTFDVNLDCRLATMFVSFITHPSPGYEKRLIVQESCELFKSEDFLNTMRLLYVGEFCLQYYTQSQSTISVLLLGRQNLVRVYTVEYTM
jgi:hypothetical protein